MDELLSNLFGFGKRSRQGRADFQDTLNQFVQGLSQDAANRMTGNSSWMSTSPAGWDQLHPMVQRGILQNLSRQDGELKMLNNYYQDMPYVNQRIQNQAAHTQPQVGPMWRMPVDNWS